MSEKKVKLERKKVEEKKITEQELIMQAQKLHQEKLTKAGTQIKKILAENNLTMEVEHVIKFVPNKR